MVDSFATFTEPAALGHPSQSVSEVPMRVREKHVDAVSETRLVAAKRYRRSPDGFPTYDPAPTLECTAEKPHAAKS